MLEEVLPDVVVALANAIVCLTGNTLLVLANEERMEEHVGCFDQLITQGQLSTVRQVDLLGAAVHVVLSLLQLGIEVLRHIATPLLDEELDFAAALPRVVNKLGVLRLHELANQKVRQVIATHTDGLNSVRDCIALEDGHGVRYTGT